jgi:hypothetical protein
MWFDGFYTYRTDLQISSALRNCTNLTTVSLPWTTLRHLAAQDWAHLLVGAGVPLQSLELLAVDLPAAVAAQPDNQIDRRPLDSPLVDFSRLRRLKVFGDSTFMPIDDRDLQAIARTATSLEEFHLTCLSTISIDGKKPAVLLSTSARC